MQIWNHTYITDLRGPALRKIQVQFHGQLKLSLAGTAAAERSIQTLCLSLIDPIYCASTSFWHWFTQRRQAFDYTLVLLLPKMTFYLYSSPLPPNYKELYNELTLCKKLQTGSKLLVLHSPSGLCLASCARDSSLTFMCLLKIRAVVLKERKYLTAAAMFQLCRNFSHNMSKKKIARNKISSSTIFAAEVKKK